MRRYQQSALVTRQLCLVRRFLHLAVAAKNRRRDKVKQYLNCKSVSKNNFAERDRIFVIEVSYESLEKNKQMLLNSLL